jgi:hypothetical protein
MPLQQVQETFDWLKPSPLWSADGSDIRNGDLFRPRLLRFDTDRFVDAFLAVVKQSAMSAGTALGALVLKVPQDGTPLRLYQPAHGVFHLVCASLCCRQAGFPDRTFQRAKGDRVVFVIRKLAQDGSEWGWTGPSGQKTWAPISQPASSVAPDEDRLPLMNVDTQDGRTLLFGYVPVGSRETYAASQGQLNDPSIKYELRVQEFGSRFTGNLVPYPPPEKVPSSPAPDGKSILEQFTDPKDQLTVSVNILRDLVDFFDQYLPDIGQALNLGAIASLSAASQAVVDLLDNQIIQNSVTIWDALKLAAAERDQIDAGVDVGSLNFDDDYNLVHLIKTLNGASPTGMTDYATQLNMAVQAALPPDQAPSFQLPKFGGNDRYVLRLAYERTACIPPQQWLSRKSDPFELAGFFDSDAPARPIRIPLPGDVSLAGLRKFKKNVSVIMTDSMRRKMAMVTGHEKDIATGNGAGGDPGPGIGFICSFSIQIIFIVAFMLLLIFVFMLNIVFFWLPFFKICFPVPSSLAPKDN